MKYRSERGRTREASFLSIGLGLLMALGGCSVHAYSSSTRDAPHAANTDFVCDPEESETIYYTGYYPLKLNGDPLKSFNAELEHQVIMAGLAALQNSRIGKQPIDPETESVRFYAIVTPEQEQAFDADRSRDDARPSTMAIRFATDHVLKQFVELETHTPGPNVNPYYFAYTETTAPTAPNTPRPSVTTEQGVMQMSVFVPESCDEIAARA